MAIKAIIFDCFGVLYRDNISMLYDAVEPEHHQALQDIIHATDHGFLTRDEYYQQVAELTADKTPDDIHAIERRQHVRDEDMIALAWSLKPRFKIGLLSNIDSSTIHRLFSEDEQQRLFDAFVVSGEIGITKPSLGIFTLAAERLGVRPDECVMVDDIARNVEGAQLAGMQALLFTSRPQCERDLARLLGTAEGQA